MQNANNTVSRMGREDDMNLGLAKEFCSSVIKVSEGKTRIHLVNVSVKEI